MELPASDIGIFISLILILAVALIALVADLLNGNMELLREENTRLRAREDGVSSFLSRRGGGRRDAGAAAEAETPEDSGQAAPEPAPTTPAAAIPESAPPATPEPTTAPPAAAVPESAPPAAPAITATAPAQIAEIASPILGRDTETGRTDYPRDRRYLIISPRPGRAGAAKDGALDPESTGKDPRR